MGRTRDLFKKIRDTKGTFHAKMGKIKDRNYTDLTEADNINKRWQEYTEEVYKKDLTDPDNYDGVITHLEPDILECEVKWVSGSITTKLMKVTEFLLFQNFPQFVVIHSIKGFDIVNKAEVGVFLELSCFFDDPADVGNLVSDSSAFSKSSLNIWELLVYLL